jgi:hypothetical protein
MNYLDLIVLKNIYKTPSGLFTKPPVDYSPNPQVDYSSKPPVEYSSNPPWNKLHVWKEIRNLSSDIEFLMSAAQNLSKQFRGCFSNTELSKNGIPGFYVYKSDSDQPS